jgi:hypothetical protein
VRCSECAAAACVDAACAKSGLSLFVSTGGWSDASWALRPSARYLCDGRLGDFENQAQCRTELLSQPSDQSAHNQTNTQTVLNAEPFLMQMQNQITDVTATETHLQFSANTHTLPHSLTH